MTDPSPALPCPLPRSAHPARARTRRVGGDSADGPTRSPRNAGPNRPPPARTASRPELAEPPRRLALASRLRRHRLRFANDAAVGWTGFLTRPNSFPCRRVLLAPFTAL